MQTKKYQKKTTFFRLRKDAKRLNKDVQYRSCPFGKLFLAKYKALRRIEELTQKQRREQNTLYKRNNISFNQCIGESKTPVSEWLNVSGWREWE